MSPLERGATAQLQPSAGEGPEPADPFEPAALSMPPEAPPGFVVAPP